MNPLQFPDHLLNDETSTQPPTPSVCRASVEHEYVGLWHFSVIRVARSHRYFVEKGTPNLVNSDASLGLLFVELQSSFCHFRFTWIARWVAWMVHTKDACMYWWRSLVERH